MAPPNTSGTQVLLDRYVLARDQLLGQGGFASVYKGLDKKECVNVAIKVYDMEDESGLTEFKSAISVLQNIEHHAKQKDSGVWERQKSMNNFALREKIMSSMTGAEADKLLQFLDDVNVGNCMVELLDFSVDADLNPGVDEESNMCFMIMELGGETLRERLNSHGEDQGGNGALPPEELKDLLWSLVCIVWTLHSAGYVHLDIKPENVVLFKTGCEKGMWKLIDLDGAIRAGAQLTADSGTCSPLYMSPECACAIKDNANTTASRVMDVWSVAMCAMDAIFLQPVLEPWYKQWAEETGGNLKYLQWLSDPLSDDIVSGDMKELLETMDKDLCDLLASMLERSPQDRPCMAKCLMHPYFESCRQSTKTTNGRSKSRSRSKSKKGAVSHACAVM